MENEDLYLENIYDLLVRDITDQNMRQYIFGTKKFEDAILNTSKYVQYIKNILSLSFYFAYACYRFDEEQGSNITSKLSKHNSKRIAKSLKEAFVRFPATHELIQFVLTDIQFDLAQGNSELKKVFGNLSNYDMSEFSFNPYFRLIAEYNKNPSRFLFDELKLRQMLLELLETLTFLKEYELRQDDTDLFTFARKPLSRSKDPFKELTLNHIFFRDDSRYLGGIYHLFSVETQTAEHSDILTLRYFTPAGDRSVAFTLSQEDNAEGEDENAHLEGQRPNEVLYEITGMDPSAQDSGKKNLKNSNSIDQVHTINYKYIKNLALAISDAISANKGSKQAIFTRFHPVYPYIFELPAHASEDPAIPLYESKYLDWDSIVIMLLIEASPSLVLEHLIWKVPQTFISIAENLYRRIYDVENLALFNEGEDALWDEVAKIVTEKLILGEAGGFGKLPTRSVSNRLRARAGAMLIISKLTTLEEEEPEENLIYTGNLRSNISLLQKTNTTEDVEKRIKYACIILGETLKHIMCFYSGLFAYGIEKVEYDNLVCNKCLSKTEITQHQKRLEAAFFAAARKEAARLHSFATITPAETLSLFELFIDFCRECSPSNNVLTDRARQLYVATGKYEIANLSVMKKVCSNLRAAIVDAYHCDADLWARSTLHILEYFKTGSFSNTPIDHNLFNTIYPFTAVFNRTKENSDGYKTVNFTLNLDIDDDNTTDYQADVNVLSEFTFDRSDVYYCLPNVIRSNHKWWIDPILINFKDFNDIFSDIRKDET